MPWYALKQSWCLAGNWGVVCLHAEQRFISSNLWGPFVAVQKVSSPLHKCMCSGTLDTTALLSSCYSSLEKTPEHIPLPGTENQTLAFP